MYIETSALTGENIEEAFHTLVKCSFWLIQKLLRNIWYHRNHRRDSQRQHRLVRKERHIHRLNDRECEVEPSYRETQKRRKKEIVVEWEFIVRYNFNNYSCIRIKNWRECSKSCFQQQMGRRYCWSSKLLELLICLRELDCIVRKKISLFRRVLLKWGMSRLSISMFEIRWSDQLGNWRVIKTKWECFRLHIPFSHHRLCSKRKGKEIIMKVEVQFDFNT